ncbi:MAG: hypothetical protein WC205_12525 [Opitutaceae bacterium]|jgi:outer membrane lipoprotein-sorting protein
MGYPLRWLLFVCALTTLVRADFARDLARIHVEASGGQEQVNALKSFKATGVTTGESGNLKFTLWAARPDLIRIEVNSGTRIIVQGWDGKSDPWTGDSQTKRITLLSGEAADAFKSEAEFDDPLLAGADRKTSLDYVGEVEVEGRSLLKVVVTLNFISLSYVYLDPETYMIVRRDVVRPSGGAEAIVRTDYSDFKPVAGVMIPHRLVISQNGKRLRETVIEHMEPNPELSPGLFAVPPVTGGKPGK